MLRVHQTVMATDPEYNTPPADGGGQTNNLIPDSSK